MAEGFSGSPRVGLADTISEQRGEATAANWLTRTRNGLLTICAGSIGLVLAGVLVWHFFVGAVLVTPDAVAWSAAASALFALPVLLLSRAAHYGRACPGLRWMSWRSRLGVLRAFVLCRRIARAARARGPAALSHRTVLPRWRLVSLAVAATASLLHPRVWGSAPSAPPDVECRTV